MAYRLSYSHLLREFGALGPYLCPEQCEPDRFFFDSRNPAVFPRHSGWGWWLLLEPCEGGFSGQSELAGYSATGIWLNRPVPRSLWPELASSRDQFLGRLTSSPTFALCVSGGGFPLLGDSCSRSTWFLLHRAA